MDRKFTLIFCLISFMHVLPLMARQGEGKLLIRHYPDEVYRGHPVNWTSVMDNKGTIYFGNRSVLLAYDGVDWKRIRTKLLAPVYTLFRSADEKIYLGTQDDFGYLDTDSLGHTIYRSLSAKLPPDHKKTGIIWKIHQIGETIYFQSKSRLIALQDGQFKIYEPEDRFHFSFTIDNKLYIRENKRGLLIMRNGQLVPFSSFFRGDVSEHLIYAMMPFDTEKILTVTRKEGLFLVDRNTGEAEPFVTSGDTEILQSLPYGGLRLRDGNFAVNTLLGGVFILNKNGRIVRKIDRESGLKTQNIRHLYQDMQGGLWLSTNEGVYRVGIDIPITYWDVSDGLEGSLQHMIEFDKNTYIATSKGIYIKNGNQFSKISGFSGEAWKFAIFRSGKRSQLLAATSQGIYEVTRNRVDQVTDSKCTYLFIHPKIPDRLWVTEDDKLTIYHHRANRWENVGKVELINNRVIDIKADEKGNVWIGTDFGGLFRFKNCVDENCLSDPDYTLYNASNGLKTIEEIRIEIYNDTILALAGHNIYRYRPNDDSFETYKIGANRSSKDSLETIFLQVDTTGSYWIQRNETDYSLIFERAIKQKCGEYLIETIPFKMIPRKLARQVISRPDGDFWILFSNAIFRYDPSQDYIKEKRHVTLINKLVTSQDTTFLSLKRSPDNLNSWGLPEELPYRYNDLAFWYNSSCLRDEQSNTYQYMLAGDENKWSEWTSQPFAYYTNLHEGDYQFMVRSRGFDEMSSDVSVYKFSVLPPWYRSVPAYIVYLVISMCFVWLLLKLNTRRISRQNEMLEMKVTARTAEILNQNIKIKSQQKEIIEQNKELQLLNKEKNFLLGAVAHDLKNPLNSIYSVSQLINMDPEQLDEEQQEYINQIAQISLGLTDKVNEILDVTVIDAKQNTIPLKRGEISDLVSEVVKNLQPIALRKEISLVYKDPDTRFFAFYEANYMRKVLQNLLDNAIKFSEKGKEIRICLQHTGEKLRIMIRDQGPGINEKDQERLFQRFTTLTARPTNGEKSTGLGLSIVKRCVEAMNGKVWCESEPGEGATFIIEI